MPNERPNQVHELYLRVIRRMDHYQWFAFVFKHVGTPVDRALLRVSRGRLSMSGSELPTMLLTTTGRRTGKERTVPLHYVWDGKNLVAVCENFGLDTRLKLTL
jgi:F420H(2)-dependent quinone reductase